MAARGAERAPAFIDPPGYARHRPEETLLCRITAEHYPAFREARAAEGKPLPRYVEEEFEAYLKCGRLEEGFLRVRCEGCRAEKLVAFSCKRPTLQTLPAQERRPDEDRLARAHGFSLHAGVAVAGAERTRLEHLVRYVARPAVALERLALTPGGNVRYTLKTPYRDGTTQVLFEPFDFLSRLAALVPLPRIHLVRYHGVFASASTLRAAVTPAGRGRGAPRREPPSSHPPKHISLTWMKRLKRVFGIEIERCRRCGGALKVIASIEDPGVIERILAHRQSTSEEEGVAAFAARAPPQPPLL